MQDYNKAFNKLRLYFMIAAIMVALPNLLNLYSGQTGRLLVATQKLKGTPFFDQKVIYVFDHSFWGAKGIIINQPLKNNDPDKYDINHKNAHIYNGGPVAFPLLKIVALNRPKEASKWRIQPLTVVDYKGFEDSFPAYSDDNAELDVYIGYSRWGIGQLESEIKNGAWIVVDCNISKLYNKVANSELWQYLSENNEKDICR